MLGLDLRRLGTPDLTYRRLKVAVDGLRRADAEWSTTDHLLALIADHLAAANWQRGGKGPRPKPIKRPGYEPEHAGLKRHGGGGQLDMEQAREMFFRKD